MCAVESVMCGRDWARCVSEGVGVMCEPGGISNNFVSSKLRTVLTFAAPAVYGKTFKNLRKVFQNGYSTGFVLLLYE